MDETLLRELLSQGETLTIEFKRDQPQQISDREICEVIVCLANSQDGTLLIGVEDDGTVTGAAYVAREGKTTNAECQWLRDFSSYQASRLLSRLAAEGKLKAIGEKRWCYYVLPES